MLLLFPHFCFSQNNDAGLALLNRLDSVQNSSSVSRHFGMLYFKTTRKAILFFSKKDTSVQNFMQRLEQRFAGYFFTAAVSFNQKKEVPLAWKTYYADTSLTSIQYYLIGANAHINGDMWQALTSEFLFQELKDNKKFYYRYNRKLNEELFEVYNSAFESASGVRLLHAITLGLDKQYSKLMLVRWRKRQMKLSMLWFYNKARFKKKLSGVRKKMAKLDKLVLQHL
jgi:hypothetical protein